MIRLRAITKSFRGMDGHSITVLDNVDLDLPAGRCIGLVGDPGSGKTTLLRLLAGLDLPDSGTLAVDGRISLPLGQSPAITPQLSGRENTVFVARVLGLPVARTVAEVAELSGLGAYFDEAVVTYDGPQRMRLNYAVTMAARYDWYLFDDRIVAGDEAFREKAEHHFDSLKQRAGVILASDKPKLLARHCDSIVVLANASAQYFSDLEHGLGLYRQLSDRFPRHAPPQAPTGNAGERAGRDPQVNRKHPNR